MYQFPTVHPPSLEDVRQMSCSLGLDIAEADIPEFHDTLKGIFDKSYSTLEKYPEPRLPVKYPRTPGYRPHPEENKYNAWYCKTEIPGASEGILKGYRVVIKDNFAVAGVPCMNGSRIMEGYVPDYDPTVVTRLLDAGATIVGKGVCENFCFSGNSFTSVPFPVLNPHDPTRSCGGSSSGCAVLVQTKEADMALGSDQGGSVRLPSCWTGIVGLKPTYGLLPYTGLGGLAPALDHCGPMTRTVKDCALMLQAMAGYDDGLDPRQIKIPASADLPKYSEVLSGDVSGHKIGLLLEGFEDCEEDVATLVRNVAEKLRSRGATVEDVSVPIHKDGEAIFLPTCTEGTFHTMIRSQGSPVGPPSYYPTSSIDNYFANCTTRGRDASGTLKVTQMIGKYTSDRYGMHFYAKSQNLLRYARDQYNAKLADYDMLIMPTIKFKAPKLPGKDATLKDLLHPALNMIHNTAIFNGTGHPALSLPAGFSEGLPVGMMIVGRHLQDDKVLNVAYAYEQIINEGK